MQIKAFKYNLIDLIDTGRCFLADRRKRHWRWLWRDARERQSDNSSVNNSVRSHKCTVSLCAKSDTASVAYRTIWSAYLLARFSHSSLNWACLVRDSASSSGFHSILTFSNRRHVVGSSLGLGNLLYRTSGSSWTSRKQLRKPMLGIRGRWNGQLLQGMLEILAS